MEFQDTITFGKEEEDIEPLRLTFNSTKDGICSGMNSVHSFGMRIAQKEHELNILKQAIEDQKRRLQEMNNMNTETHRQMELEQAQWSPESAKTIKRLDDEYAQTMNLLADLTDHLHIISTRQDLISDEIAALHAKQDEQSSVELALEEHEEEIDRIIAEKTERIDSEVEMIRDEISNYELKCLETQHVIEVQSSLIDDLAGQRDIVTTQVATVQKNGKKLASLKDKSSTIHASKLSRLECELSSALPPTGDCELLKERITRCQQKISSMKKKYKETKRKLVTAVTMRNEFRQKIADSKQQIIECAEEATTNTEKSIHAKETNHLIEKKLSDIITYRKQKEQVMRELQDASLTLTRSYEIEMKQNQVLPPLLHAIFDIEQATEALEQSESKLLIRSKNEDTKFEESQERFDRLERQYQDLHVKVKLAKVERKRLRNILLNSPDPPSPLSQVRLNSQTHEAIQSRLAEVNKSIDVLRKQILKEKEARKTQILRKTALENQMKAKHEEAQSMLYSTNNTPRRHRNNDTIANLELRIETKRRILNERKHKYQERCAELTQNLEKRDCRSLIDTNALGKDYEAKVLVQKHCCVRF